ncbi:hypothetical protein [Novipirellula artificiosorum]|nr:hypothetical protein [Novipirellula artificiosorum]
MKWKSLSSMSTRKYVVADPHVQGAILRRVVLYALAAVLYYCVVLFFSVYASDRDGTQADRWIALLDNAITWLPGLCVLGPIAAYDLLSTTNRFAGPVCRLRREMKLLIDDQSPAPLRFRDKDHWCEMADLFNELREEMLELREHAKQNAADRSAASAEDLAEVLI